MENMVGPTVYPIYPHRCGTAVKPIVYLLLIMASTEPQKLLFRGVPGVCHLYVIGQYWVCNYYQFPYFHRKKEICSSGKNKHGTEKILKNN